MNKLAFALLVFLLLVLGGVVYSNSSAEDAPGVIKAVAPKDYPPLAAAANIRGKVKVEVKIDSAGNVVSAKLIEGHKLLQDMSKTAALRWKFARSEEGNKERTVQLTFTFTHWTERKEEERGTTTFIPPYEIEVVGRTIVVQRESIQ